MNTKIIYGIVLISIIAIYFIYTKYAKSKKIKTQAKLFGIDSSGLPRIVVDPNKTMLSRDQSGELIDDSRMVSDTKITI